MSTADADRFKAQAKRQALRVIHRIVGTALFLAVCMWAFIGWSQWSEYTTARMTGRTEGFNLTAAFASELTVTFDSVSTQLHLIERDLQRVPRGIGEDAVREHIRQMVGALTGLGTEVRIIGSDGQRFFSTLGPDTGPTDYRQSGHFVMHRDDPSVGLIIDTWHSSGPHKLVKVTKRLETADGQFAGEVMLLLRPDALISLNRSIDVGRRGMIVITSPDGIVRAGFDQMHLDGSVGIGADLRGDSYPSDLEPGGIAVFARHSRLADVEHLVTVRRLERYPLDVLVALDMDDVLGPARNHIWLIGLIGVGATGLICVLTLLLSREIWRRTAREIELAYDRDRLRSAQDRIEADRARLKETNRELLASKKIAEAANLARSQFLAHMSHELRTPLHAIIGFSELIQDQAPTNQGGVPVVSYAGDILSSGRHLLELINTILDISKVESGTAILTETVFPIAEVMRNSMVSVKAQAEARNIAIELKLPAPATRLLADRTRLLQVLINLLSNAVKFTPENGRIVLAFAELSYKEVAFSVTDTGIGMTENEIEIALEPFGQVDNTLSRSFEGTGLGLPLARKLTELHGGRLELTSIKGCGTTASIILPAERVHQRDGVRVGGV